MPRSMTRYFFCCLVLLQTLSTTAQSYAFVSHSVRQGLVQSQVRCLFEDSKGYLWAGTLGGVSRFDGSRFTNYTRENGLAGNQISAIAELPDGRIAVGAVGSISVINGDDVHTLHLPDDQRESTVNALYADHSGVLIGTESGLFHWKDDVLSHAGIGGLERDEHIKSFIPPWRNRPLMIVARDAIYQMSGSEAVLFYRPSDPEVYLFDADWMADGSLAIACRKEALIILKENKTERAFGKSKDLPSTTFSSVYCEDNGACWLTSRFGISRFEAGRFETYDARDGLPTPDVRDVLIDAEGNVWLASYGSGLLRFAGSSLSTYTTRHGLSSNAVMSIAEDGMGSMWFATFDQGVCVLNGDTIVPTGIPGLGQGARVWSTLADSRGGMWFGTSEGIVKVDNSKVNLVSVENGLPDRTVLCFHEMSPGVVIAGTGNGPVRIIDESVERMDHLPGFPSTRVRGLTSDRAENLWLATRDGVYKFDGTRFTHFGLESGLPDLSSYCVTTDSFNRTWVGTQAGLVCIEGSMVRLVKVSDTPGSSTINFLHFAEGRLWTGTLNGLYISDWLQPDRLPMKWTAVREEDGLRSPETNLNAVYHDSKGLLWFGTPDGVVKLDILRAGQFDKEVIPRLVLSGMLVNLEARRMRPSGTETFSHKERHFTFYCDAISMRYPGRTYFQYLLDGFDSEWGPPVSAQSAVYGNLSSGSYRFLARARVGEGAWSEPIVYEFVVLAPWWLSWWFLLGAATAGGGLTGWVIRRRRAALKLAREMEMSEMRARMLALEQQSLNSSMNRHFIFNALNSIQYYINRQDRQAANKYLTDFARLIRKNLDSSQEETTSLRDELERLQLYLRLEHMRFSDKFEYRLTVDPLLDLDRIRVPGMLLQPFLENSIWHGLLPKESAGLVDVEVRKRDGQVEFVITDNGVGIDASRSHKEETEGHISQGMQITRNRIALLQKMKNQQISLEGPYQLNDEKGQPRGTQVCIRIPVSVE